jgi:hypothetical protein
MARPDDVAVHLDQIRKASGPASLLTALRHLKNGIIGHVGKKEDVILNGGVHMLSELCAPRRAHGKKRTGEVDWPNADSDITAESMALEDQIRLQAFYILSSLANSKSCVTFWRAC